MGKLSICFQVRILATNRRIDSWFKQFALWKYFIAFPAWAQQNDSGKDSSRWEGLLCHRPGGDLSTHLQHSQVYSRSELQEACLPLRHSKKSGNLSWRWGLQMCTLILVTIKPSGWKMFHTVHVPLSRKHNVDKDSPNNSTHWQCTCLLPYSKIYRLSMWMRINLLKVKLSCRTTKKCFT